jgi:hypothetical protein
MAANDRMVRRAVYDHEQKHRYSEVSFFQASGESRHSRPVTGLLSQWSQYNRATGRRQKRLGGPGYLSQSTGRGGFWPGYGRPNV